MKQTSVIQTMQMFVHPSWKELIANLTKFNLVNLDCQQVHSILGHFLFFPLFQSIKTTWNVFCIYLAQSILSVITVHDSLESDILLKMKVAWLFSGNCGIYVLKHLSLTLHMGTILQSTNKYFVNKLKALSYVTVSLEFIYK